jgi:hypothetical protein
LRGESEPSAVVLAGLVAVEDALVRFARECVDRRSIARSVVVVIDGHSGGVVADTNSPVRLCHNIGVE